MKYLTAPTLLMALLLGCATQYPPNKSTPSYPTQTINKVGIISTEIFGLTVGMSPRRVLLESQQNNWRLDSLSSITLEDMVESGIRDAVFYISTNNESKSNLEIHFRNNRVIFLRQTFSISEEQLQSELEKARSHLGRLGHFDEEVEDLSIKLVYKPYVTGYVYYNFHKLTPNQKGYRVWLAVADYGL
jgi:hypothetical protein